MSRRNFRLTVNHAQLDSVANELRASLTAWGEANAVSADDLILGQAAGGPRPGAPAGASAGGAGGGRGFALDSLAVTVAIVAIIEPVIQEIDPTFDGDLPPELLVRRGGYINPMEMADDMIRRLRRLCISQDAPASVEA